MFALPSGLVAVEFLYLYDHTPVGSSFVALQVFKFPEEFLQLAFERFGLVGFAQKLVKSTGGVISEHTERKEG